MTVAAQAASGVDSSLAVTRGDAGRRPRALFQPFCDLVRVPADSLRRQPHRARKFISSNECVDLGVAKPSRLLDGRLPQDRSDCHGLARCCAEPRQSTYGINAGTSRNLNSAKLSEITQRNSAIFLSVALCEPLYLGFRASVTSSFVGESRCYFTRREYGVAPDDLVHFVDDWLVCRAQ